MVCRLRLPGEADGDGTLALYDADRHLQKSSTPSRVVVRQTAWVSDWWQVVLAVSGSLVAVWLSLVALFCLLGRRYDDPARLRDALRLLPDVLRLLRRLAADPAVPRGVRVRLVLLGIYLVLPIDVVPDFIPVIGYADDVVLIALVLRSVARRAGADALDRHWPGTPEGLATLKQLAGVR
ncbi:MAG: hypothetical protein JWR55_2899 [Aeromicrobium sp.]|nr:hypothetical protein [Aeromicrobium sp.]